MIQRIQTIYMTLAIIVLALLLYFPIAELTQSGEVVIYILLGFVKKLNGKTQTLLGAYPNLAIAVLFTILQIYAIISFKNRKLQMKLCKLSLFMLVLLYASILIYVYFIWPDTPESIKYLLGIIFPAISFILVFLANKAIKKDDDLIKSVDRIR